MPKFKVGIDYTITGLTYISVEADNEDAAEAKAKAFAQDAIVSDLGSGADFEYDICDVIPG